MDCTLWSEGDARAARLQQRLGLNICSLPGRSRLHGCSCVGSYPIEDSPVRCTAYLTGIPAPLPVLQRFLQARSLHRKRCIEA